MFTPAGPRIAVPPPTQYRLLKRPRSVRRSYERLRQYHLKPVFYKPPHKPGGIPLLGGVGVGSALQCAHRINNLRSGKQSLSSAGLVWLSVPFIACIPHESFWCFEAFFRKVSLKLYLKKKNIR